jgi:hypothetical protein
MAPREAAFKVVFEPGSETQKIQTRAFAGTKLAEIRIARSVEILCSACFYGCTSLEIITFESPSSLTRIESKSFASSGLKQIEIPKSVEILCSE